MQNPRKSRKALIILLQFSTSLSKSGFSTWTNIRRKTRENLKVIDKEMITASSAI